MTPQRSPTIRASGDKDPPGAFRQGLLTNLLNPKAMVFVTSVLPQFADGSWALPAQLALLGAVDVVFGLGMWAGLIGIGAHLSSWLSRPQVQRWWQRVNGMVLIGIGLLLAVTHA